MTSKPPPGFSRYRARGADLVRHPEAFLAVVGRALAKLVGSVGAERALAKVANDIRTMAEMVRAWARGEYTGVARGSLILIAAALTYLVVPTDLVPDFIVALGLLDDAAVIGYVVNAIRQELVAFRLWQQARAETGDAPQNPGTAETAPDRPAPAR